MTDISAVAVSPTAAQKTDVPQTIAFTATPTGGTGTVHYQWQANVNSGGYSNRGTDSSSFTYTSLTGDVGSLLVKVIAWDAGATNNSFATGLTETTPTTITVGAAIIITLVPSSPTNISNTESFSEVPTVSGGSNASNFAYLWQSCTVDGLNQAALSPTITTSTLGQTPSASGVYYYILRITESGLTANNVIYSAVLTVNVKSFYDTVAGITGYMAKIAHAVGQ